MGFQIILSHPLLQSPRLLPRYPIPSSFLYTSVTMAPLTTELTTPITGTYQQPIGLFIDGKWVEGVDKKKFEVINPSTEETITSICEVTSSSSSPTSPRRTSTSSLPSSLSTTASPSPTRVPMSAASATMVVGPIRSRARLSILPPTCSTTPALSPLVSAVRSSPGTSLFSCWHGRLALPWLPVTPLS